MNDKQQLAAMGEHVREAADYEPRITHDARIGGVVFKTGVKISTVIDAAYRAAEYHNEHHKPNPESIKKVIDAVRNSASDFKVPDGWKLVPMSVTEEMERAAMLSSGGGNIWWGLQKLWDAALRAAPEYKP